MTLQWAVPTISASVGNFLELWLIGIILSAMVYGGVLSLSLSYLSLLKSSYTISRRMRYFLLVYVTFMVAISTAHIITSIIAVRDNIPFSGTYCTIFACALGSRIDTWSQDGFESVLCIMLASWGADAFMVSKFQRERRFDGFSFFLR